MQPQVKLSLAFGKMGFLTVAGIMFLTFTMGALLTQSGDEDDDDGDGGILQPVYNQASS